ncbi:glucose 1-dehydrogenase-like [Aplysia californica]|uniref:Glucose 1-dehydrogenase-like n=1 Tax=Aplysia californica TaxID=6500 RepID=A0ABM1A790_APLCA|nr:glucose 1-dehydrogenase-like [Aplysia californica]
MAPRFEGKVAVVTGASSGIGEAIVIKLAEEGAKITLCGRDVARLELALGKCAQASKGHPERFVAVSGDVCDDDYLKKILSETIKTFGRLDIVVPNAGAGDVARTEFNITSDDFNEAIDINLKSVFS